MVLLSCLTIKAADVDTLLLDTVYINKSFTSRAQYYHVFGSCDFVTSSTAKEPIETAMMRCYICPSCSKKLIKYLRKRKKQFESK